MIDVEKSPSDFKGSYDGPSQAGPSYSYADAPPPSYPGPSNGSGLRLDLQKMPPPMAHMPSFAPSPDGTPGPELTGDNPKGFMGHVKNFAPGKDPKTLLNPPPPSFGRAPAPAPYSMFPAMVLIGKGNTLDRGFPYIPPDSPLVPHPFVTHDVNEQDWRRFLHDMRVAGSLSPMNRVVAGLAPLALGIGIIFGMSFLASCGYGLQTDHRRSAGFFIVKGVDSLLKRTKKGPVSQLIDAWNHVRFRVHLYAARTQRLTLTPPEVLLPSSMHTYRPHARPPERR